MPPVHAASLAVRIALIYYRLHIAK